MSRVVMVGWGSIDDTGLMRTSVGVNEGKRLGALAGKFTWAL